MTLIQAPIRLRTRMVGFTVDLEANIDFSFVWLGGQRVGINVDLGPLVGPTLT
jgi:hypothetical protein